MEIKLLGGILVVGSLYLAYKLFESTKDEEISKAQKLNMQVTGDSDLNKYIKLSYYLVWVCVFAATIVGILLILGYYNTPILITACIIVGLYLIISVIRLTKRF